MLTQGGNWLTKGDATPEALKEAKIYIKADGRLEGVMKVHHMYTSLYETAHKPIIVDLEETTGKLVNGSRKASFKFPMGKMIGRFDFLSCAKN